jgi:hypothetical protein
MTVLTLEMFLRNAAESYCMFVGKLDHLMSCSLFLGDVGFNVQYLRVHVVGSKTLYFNVDPIIGKPLLLHVGLYSCVYYRVRNCLSELVHLSLLEGCYLPYAIML